MNLQGVLLVNAITQNKEDFLIRDRQLTRLELDSKSAKWFWVQLAQYMNDPANREEMMVLLGPSDSVEHWKELGLSVENIGSYIFTAAILEEKFKLIRKDLMCALINFRSSGQGSDFFEDGHGERLTEEEIRIKSLTVHSDEFADYTAGKAHILYAYTFLVKQGQLTSTAVDMPPDACSSSEASGTCVVSSRKNHGDGVKLSARDQAMVDSIRGAFANPEGSNEACPDAAKKRKAEAAFAQEQAKNAGIRAQSASLEFHSQLEENITAQEELVEKIKAEHDSASRIGKLKRAEAHLRRLEKAQQEQELNEKIAKYETRIETDKLAEDLDDAEKTRRKTKTLKKIMMCRAELRALESESESESD